MFNSHWKLIAACFVFSFLGGSCTTFLFNPSRVIAAQQKDATNEIRAKSFVLVDDDGAEYGRLGFVQVENGKAGRLTLSKRGNRTEEKFARLPSEAIFAWWNSDRQKYVLEVVSGKRSVWMQP